MCAAVDVWTRVADRGRKAKARLPPGGYLPPGGGRGGGGGYRGGVGDGGYLPPRGGRGGGGNRGGGDGGRGQGEVWAGTAGGQGGGGQSQGGGGRGNPRLPRPSLPRANLALRPNTVCLSMEEFGSLPNEGEFEKWMVSTVFKDNPGPLEKVLEGFKYLNIDMFRKRFLLTFEEEQQARALLDVTETHGPNGILWPGLGREVRVKAFSMDEVSLEIVVMDVAPETDVSLVRRTLEKFGRVKRCERMRLSEGRFGRVMINKVKVELVRNTVELPNIIHALGTGHSVDDFLTWKLQYRGCPRYCYGCGAASHEARQCPERGITREGLEKVKSLVGEEEEETANQEGEGAPRLTYAAVVKDPSFLERKRQEKLDIAEEATERARKEELRKEKEAEEEAKIAEENELIVRAQESLQVSDHQALTEMEEEKEAAAPTSPRGGQQQGVKRSSTSPPSTAPIAPCKKRLGDSSLRKSGENGPGQVVPVTLSQQTRKDFGLPVNEEQSEDEEEKGGPETKGGDSRSDQLGQGVILTTPSREDGGPQSAGDGGPAAELSQGGRYTTNSQKDGSSESD